MGRDSKKRKKARKLRNAEDREQFLKRTAGKRIPRNGLSFRGKERRGDKAEIAFTFSEVPVPYDNPETDNLKRRHELAMALWEKAKGEPSS